MVNTTNPKTRAVVSALRSGIPALRKTAIDLVDEALEQATTGKRALALQIVWDASPRTATTILKEREKYTKSGRAR